jgi:hypothetical protein
MIRRTSLFVALTGALLLGVVGTASADTTLGSTAQPAGSIREDCGGPGVVIAQFTDNPATPYFVPGAGKITQWETNTAFATPGDSISFAVLKPVGGGSYSVVGADSRNLPNPLPASGVASFSISTPIPVSGGETLGLSSSSPCYWRAGSVPAASSLIALTEPSPPPTSGQTLNPSDISPPGFTMNVAATFVPNPTGQRAAALKKCKKKHRKAIKKKTASHSLTPQAKKKLNKKFKQCKRAANLLPV